MMFSVGTRVAQHALQRSILLIASAVVTPSTTISPAVIYLDAMTPRTSNSVVSYVP